MVNIFENTKCLTSLTRVTPDKILLNYSDYSFRFLGTFSIFYQPIVFFVILKSVNVCFEILLKILNKEPNFGNSRLGITQLELHIGKVPEGRESQ